MSYSFYLVSQNEIPTINTSIVVYESLSDDVRNHMDSKECPLLVHENDPDEYGDPFEALYNEILDTVPAE